MKEFVCYYRLNLGSNFTSMKVKTKLWVTKVKSGKVRVPPYWDPSTFGRKEYWIAYKWIGIYITHK